MENKDKFDNGTQKAFKSSDWTRISQDTTIEQSLIKKMVMYIEEERIDIKSLKNNKYFN